MKSRSHSALLRVVATTALASSLACTLVDKQPASREQRFDLIVANGRVMDPESGLDAVRHIGIANGRIEAISLDPLLGADVIDASGRVVAPGFIDLNTYEHGDPFFRLRAADGVTAVLNLEGGAVDLRAYYAALEGRALIHYGAAADHGSLRHLVQGDDSLRIVGGANEARGDPELDLRPLTGAELEELRSRVEQALREGAVGLGFGLEYTPGATHSEVQSLVELAAKFGAPCHFHAREFDPVRDWDQLNELFGAAIRSGADVHVKHLNSIFGSYCGEALLFIERARSHGLSITTECYPYTAGSTFIESALFDDWESRPDEWFARKEWPPTGERLTRESFGRYRAEGGVIVLHPRDEAKQESAVRDCLAHPLPMIVSDGAWDGGKTHPRSAGTNSRVLGRYVRDEGVLTLMDALRRMSLEPARHLEARVPAMRRKGRASLGADADLVVFDPATVIDRATYAAPTLPPFGIDAVLVGGIPIVRGGELQDGAFPGQPIRGSVEHEQAPPSSSVRRSR